MNDAAWCGLKTLTKIRKPLVQSTRVADQKKIQEAVEIPHHIVLIILWSSISQGHELHGRPSAPHHAHPRQTSLFPFSWIARRGGGGGGLSTSNSSAFVRLDTPLNTPGVSVFVHCSMITILLSVPPASLVPSMTMLSDFLRADPENSEFRRCWSRNWIFYLCFTAFSGNRGHVDFEPSAELTRQVEKSTPRAHQALVPADLPHERAHKLMASMAFSRLDVLGYRQITVFTVSFSETGPAVQVSTERSISLRQSKCSLVANTFGSEVVTHEAYPVDPRWETIKLSDAAVGRSLRSVRDSRQCADQRTSA